MGGFLGQCPSPPATEFGEHCEPPCSGVCREFQLLKGFCACYKCQIESSNITGTKETGRVIIMPVL